MTENELVCILHYDTLARNTLDTALAYVQLEIISQQL